MSDPSETSADGVFLPDDRPAEQPAPPDRAVESPIRTQKPHGKPPRVRRVFRWLPVILFLATCLTTCWAGFLTLPSQLTRVDPGTGKTIRFVYRDSATGMTYPVIDQRQSILNGLYYALAVMTTLAAHEAGHYLAARYHRVPATLPMFIPMPIGPIGTMGAVIFQESGIANRRALFDIAIAGPLAGLAIALPLNWWGVKHSEIMASGGMGFTNPRIVEWMIAYIHRPLNPGEDILNNPMVHAGWVGIFITALNLMPIGQLDGGHVLYCLIGRRAHWVARGLWFGGLAFAGIQALRGQSEYLIGWSIMLTLLWMMGTRHPPTSDDNVPLGWPRILLGWATLSFVLVGFIPTPMYFSPPANSKSAATTAAETNQATSAHETDQESPEDPN